MGIGDWGLGIGDWGLGIGLEDNTQYILKVKLTNDSCLLENLKNNSIINKERNINYISPEIWKIKNIMKNVIYGV